MPRPGLALVHFNDRCGDGVAEPDGPMAVLLWLRPINRVNGSQHLCL
jgi:hypothetical protein